jgi:hypothetical protein
MRLLRLALACAAAACAAAAAPRHPPHNASGCPALRTEHVHHFEHACLHAGAEPPHSGARLPHCGARWPRALQLTARLLAPCAAGRYVGGHERHRDMRGTFQCACCGAPLFPGDTRYDSGTGCACAFGER